MKKLIGFLSVVLLFSVSAFSSTPWEGAMLFSKGCPSYQFPIVFVYQNGNMRTSDFQVSTKTVASWGKFDETHFYVKTTAADSFYCATLPTSYSGMGWVNKKQPMSYFNGVYYNATKDSIYLLDYPNRNAIDFFNGDLSGGVTIPHLVYHDSGSQSSYPYFNFGSKILCYNPISPMPFSNVFVISDTTGEQLSYKIQWVCADKRFVPDSLDSLNSGINFYDYNGKKGFLVVVPDDQDHYEFVSVDGIRFVIPWLIQDGTNQYRNAVMDSWDWVITNAKPVSANYLAKYPLSGTVPVSYKTSKFLLKNKNFSNKKWEVVGMWGLKEISDSSALANYGANWQLKLVEVPDACLASYSIAGGSVSVKPLIKPEGKQPNPFSHGAIGTGAYYRIDGRKVVNASRAAYGLNIVQMPNGKMAKTMNLQRQLR
jgi:hypothetical protein